MAIKGRDIIAFLAVKYKQNWAEIYNAIKVKEPATKQAIEEVLATLKGEYICIIDDAYPEELKKVYKPPFVIFLNVEDQNRFCDVSSQIYCTKFNLGTGLTGLPYDAGVQEAIKLNLRREFDSAFEMLTDAGFDEALATTQALRFIKEYETHILEEGTPA